MHFSLLSDGQPSYSAGLPQNSLRALNYVNTYSLMAFSFTLVCIPEIT